MEEMEETVEAAAILIKYMGASILKEKCGQLVAKATSAEQAADAAGVIRADLSRAAQELEEAGEEGRLQAVVNLRAASVALVASLEGAARQQLHALRGAAASLTRSCGEYREAAIAMVEVLRAKDEGPDRRGRGSWWWSLWRSCRRQQGLREPLLSHDVEAAMRAEEAAVDRLDVAVTLDLLSQGMPQLRQMGADLVAQARGVADAAKAARVPYDQLESATDAFQQAVDLAALLNCVGDLSAAATAVEAAESAPLNDVRDQAVRLSRACLELKQAADALGRVERGAARLRERRVAGTWWARLFGRRRRGGEQREQMHEDGAAAAAAAAAVQPGLGQGGERMPDIASFALTGSLALITYLGPNTVAERVGILPETFRFYFHGGLCIWWILQTAGMTCSAYAESPRELQCVQIIGHLGMLAVNGFTIVFTYLALGIHHKILLGGWLIAASLIHLCSFVVARRRGNQNQ